jgi:hypothetical protein
MSDARSQLAARSLRAALLITALVPIAQATLPPSPKYGGESGLRPYHARSALLPTQKATTLSLSLIDHCTLASDL